MVPPGDVPAVLKAERALGSIVLMFAGEDDSLVCMQAASQQ